MASYTLVPRVLFYLVRSWCWCSCFTDEETESRRGEPPHPELPASESPFACVSPWHCHSRTFKGSRSGLQLPAGSVLMFLFFLFCFLSDQPFLGAVLFTHGVVRHRWGKETRGVQGPRGWRGQSVRWVHRSHSRNSAAPLSGHGAWPWWAQCPGLGRGVTGLRNS